METYIIGIDPDTKKNGVAIFSQIKTDKKLTLKSLRFFELFDFLSRKKDEIDKVVIEGGWLNSKSNFRNTKKPGVNARIGKNVGANHETGRKIAEMCEYIGVKYEIIKPLIKIWRGPDRKITHEEFEFQTGFKFSRTNQEQRDAGMLILEYILITN